MRIESELVIEVWDSVRDFVPVNTRLDTAIKILNAFLDYGFDEKELADIVDEDHVLAEAYDLVFEIEEEDEE